MSQDEAENGVPSDQEGNKDITRLLGNWKDGDDHAMDDLIPLVYDKLQSIAKYYIRGNTPRTLSSTVLVHEAYMRVFGQRHVDFQDRNHFFAISAKIMRRLVIEYQTMRSRLKRGGGQYVFTLDGTREIGEQPNQDLAGLDECMKRLEESDKRKVWIIEMRYFVGLQLDEIADVMKVSRSTVQRDLNFAKAWLRRCLKGH